MKPPAWRAYISIPTAVLDSLPLGEEEHMWINDDTTWNLTAQRHKLSSDVMHLSSLGENQFGEKKMCGNHNRSYCCWIYQQQAARLVTGEFYLRALRQPWNILDVHFKQHANWQISVLKQWSLYRCHVQRLTVTCRVIWMNQMLKRL